MNAIRKLNRRGIALIAVFAIALSGTGLASLAVLVDQATVTVNASITTIDLKANGTKAASFDLQVIPGETDYIPVHLTNTGTGFVTVSTTSSPDASQLAAATTVHVYNDVSAANCNLANTSGLSVGDATTSDPLFTGTIQINAGAVRDYCLSYRFGTAASTFPDGLGLHQVIRFNGTHP